MSQDNFSNGLDELLVPNGGGGGYVFDIDRTA